MIRKLGDARSLCRRGMASMEAVMATGVSMPFAAALFYMGLRACKNLYHVCGSLVGWPYL